MPQGMRYAMICKRCEVQQGRQSHRMVDGHCRHCQAALKQKSWTHSQWTEGTNYEWVKNG
jgi:hypothetical protein